MGTQDDRNQPKKPQQPGGGEQRSGSNERGNPQRTSEQRDKDMNPQRSGEQRDSDSKPQRDQEEDSE